MSGEYEIYEGAPEDPLGEPPPTPPFPPPTTWQVLVELPADDAAAWPPTVVSVQPRRFPDRASALAAAARAASTYVPERPYALRGQREVYEDGPDSFLVVLRGEYRRFHMSVRVVRSLGGV